MRGLLVIAVVLFSGCMSFHSLQDGRVLSNGQSTLVYGASQTRVPYALAPQVEQEDEDEDEEPVEPVEGEESDPARLTTTHLMYRRGFEGWELGVSIMGAFAYGLDYKTSLVAGERLAIAIGGHVGAADYQTAFGAAQKARTYEAMIPLYISYDLHTAFSVYGTPSFGIVSLARDDQDRETMVLAGTVLGIHTGGRMRLYLEGFLGRDTTQDRGSLIQTASVGVSVLK